MSIFYTGKIAIDHIPKDVIERKNNSKSWQYGYDKEYDVVIISRTGQIDEVIYEVEGLVIALPKKPNEEDIVNYGLPKKDQKWNREDLPKGLNDKTVNSREFSEFIGKQFYKRRHGVWIYIKGQPIYLSPTYWFGLQWYRELREYPTFRVIQNELMLFWEACCADQRCYGMNYIKNRRFGASFLGLIEEVDKGTTRENELLGIISKTGTDAKRLFLRAVRAFKRLPSFFKPPTDGTTNPQSELRFQQQNRKKRLDETINEDDGLDTVLLWQNTTLNAFDGDPVFRIIIDENCKWEKIPFNEYWYIVRESLTEGEEIKGKAFCISTVNPLKKGGSAGKEIFDDSKTGKRNDNGRTDSGLYNIFIAADYGLSGFYDQYGFTIVENPAKPFINDKGKLQHIGSSTFLDNQESSFKSNNIKLNNQKRKYPRNITDAFRDDASECPFNLVQLDEQVEYNEEDLEDKYYNDAKKEYLGNKNLERGNLIWEDGVQDSNVVWRPDPLNGKFFIKVGCHPPTHYRNVRTRKPFFGGYSFAPTANHIGSIGVDPYNRSKVVGSRGSLGSASVVTGNHTEDDLPRNTMICEYLSRASTVELFFEDMIMLMVYFSMPVLIELSNERFLQKIKERGYRLYSMNNPFKLVKDLSPTEIEFGGAPQQDSKIADAQFYAVQSFVDKHIGFARNDEEREVGKIADFPFTRTLYQIKEVDLENRTKYDAYISFSLALLGNQKIRRMPTESNEKKLGNPFKKQPSYAYR
jgi:hypothetical protein